MGTTNPRCDSPVQIDSLNCCTPYMYENRSRTTHGLGVPNISSPEKPSMLALGGTWPVLGNHRCHLGLGSYGRSHCDWRGMNRSTLPLSAGHLHPSMGPTLVYLKRLSRCIRTLTMKISRRHDRFAKYRRLHISESDHIPLVFLQVASASDLLVTFGSLPVMTLSASSGPIRSGLQLCCASNHFSSSLITTS